MTEDNHSSRSRVRIGCLSILLIIGILCFLIGAIFSSQVFLLGIILGIGGGISLLFNAFQHSQFSQSFDNFIDWLAGLPYLYWAKFVTRPLIILVLCAIFFALVVHIPSVNDRICQKTFVSSGLICGDALSIERHTFVDSLGGAADVKIGLTESPPSSVQNDNAPPFDMNDSRVNEINIESKIIEQNHAIGAAPHVTLAVITTLSRTADDTVLSADVGLEDLKGAYLFQKDYNSQPEHKVKLCLIIGNIGVRSIVSNTMPLIMDQVALLVKQDPTFRGIIGMPFSSPTQLALQTRDQLEIDQIPLISPTATADSLSNIKNFYRINSADTTQGCVLLHFISAVLQKPAANIALFSDNTGDKYSNSLAGDFLSAQAGNNNEVCSSYIPVFPTDMLHIYPEIHNTGKDDFRETINDALQKQVDIIFFAGYADDLINLENTLCEAQREQPHPKKVLIVGGDGLYEISQRTTNSSCTSQPSSYVTVYVPPLQTDSPFAQNYIREFSSFSDTHFPPHAILTYDAVNAFAQALTPAQGVAPSQDDFDASLSSVSFNGLSGLIKFRGDKGISDPLNKDIYVVCIKQGFQVTSVAQYAPGLQPHFTKNPLWSPQTC